MGHHTWLYFMSLSLKISEQNGIAVCTFDNTSLYNSLPQKLCINAYIVCLSFCSSKITLKYVNIWNP